jgi:hypothetical protein
MHIIKYQTNKNRINIYIPVQKLVKFRLRVSITPMSADCPTLLFLFSITSAHLIKKINKKNKRKRKFDFFIPSGLAQIGLMPYLCIPVAEEPTAQQTKTS